MGGFRPEPCEVRFGGVRAVTMAPGPLMRGAAH